MYNEISMRRRRAFVVAIICALVFLALVFIPRLFESTGETVKMVSGTEYISGEPGQIIVRVSDRDGYAVEGYNCMVTVLYPDKSYFMLDQPLSGSSEAGNYYRTFITPNITGVYEETATCTNAEENKTIKVSSSFHVSLALNLIERIAKNQTDQFLDILDRFNQTKEGIEELGRLLNMTKEELNLKINETKQELNQSVNKKFERFYKDLANASQRQMEIFSNP